VVKAERESGRTEEVIETFSRAVRPVRFLNDTIDQLLGAGEIIDLLSDPEAQFVHRAVIQLEGELEPSPATELGSLMSRFMPLLVAQAAAGQTDYQPTDADVAQVLFAPAPTDHPHVYSVDGIRSDVEIIAILDPANVHGGATMDDLEGEMTVFGMIDRLLAEDRTLSLEKYLLPGLNRTMRRAMGETSVPELLGSLSDLPGYEIAADDLNVQGPAVLIKAIAIY
jgi:hypothetical protein